MFHAVALLLGALSFADEPVRTRVVFTDENRHYTLPYALVSLDDPLEGCPIDNAPTDLLQLVDEILLRINASVSKIVANQRSNCERLELRAASTRENFGRALNTSIIQNQLQNYANGLNSATSLIPLGNGYSIPASSVPLTPIITDQNRNSYQTLLQNQFLINQLSQAAIRASAIVELISTTSALITSGCIKDISDLSAVQKVAGQLLMIGGLVSTSPSGVFIAGTGLILSEFASTMRDIDKAVAALKEFQIQTSENTFLCTYRQMSKNACLMFSSPKQYVIEGIDLQFETGASAELKRKIEAIRSQSPMVFEGMSFLVDLPITDISTSVKVFDLCLKYNIHENGPLEGFFNLFIPTPGVAASFQELKTTCSRLMRFDQSTIADEEELLQITKVNISNLIFFHKSIIAKANILSQTAQDIETYRILLRQKNSIQNYRNPKVGSTYRNHYLELMSKLDDTLSTAAFKGSFRRQHKLYENTNNPEVGKNALRSLVDLCKTFDPTIACIHIHKHLQSVENLWKDSCVGHSSKLCKLSGARALLQDDPDYLAYYESICPIAKPLIEWVNPWDL